MVLVSLYNGQCPVCTAGVNNYRSRECQAETEWVDVSAQGDILQKHGVSLKDVQRYFYAVDDEGKLHKGIDAFVLVWSHIPALRWRANLLRLPLVSALAKAGYEVIAHALYGWNKLVGNF